MLTAINLLKLFSLIILGIVCFAGLGWLVVGPLLHGNLIKRKNDISHFTEFPLVIICGLIINYGFVLIFQSLQTSLILSVIIAIIGSFFYVLMWIKSIKEKSINQQSIINFLAIILVCGLLLGPMLFIPLMEWDARSIWFFHAKMIFSAGSFSQLTGWQNPDVIYFSHADYPNLLPTLAAQLSYLVGFWNEFFPKLSLLFLLIPAVWYLFSFSKRSFSFFALILLVIFCYSPKLWDGHMDGYLALFFAISMLLLSRYYKHSKRIDLFSSILCLLLLLYLKNEGNLAFIAGFCSIIIVYLLKRKSVSISLAIKNNWKLVLLFIILLLPFGIWNYLKQKWGLSNDLGLGSSQSIERILIRLSDGSLQIILQKVYGQLQNCLMLLAFLIIATLLFVRRIDKVILLPLLASGIYCLGLVVIYLATPLDLVNHLNDSVTRTMLSVSSSIYIACYFLILSLEKSEENLILEENITLSK